MCERRLYTVTTEITLTKEIGVYATSEDEARDAIKTQMLDNAIDYKIDEDFCDERILDVREED